ncbi:MAG: winged helix-turn-helix domain-containing protein [Candidatus Bathyarchaeota archaeon]
MKKTKQRRSRLEIHLDVLWTIRNGSRKPTNIMYGANLSWKPLQRVLDSLMKQGLIEEIDPPNPKDKRTNICYGLTRRGENVLNYFKKARDLLNLEAAPRIMI